MTAGDEAMSKYFTRKRRRKKTELVRGTETTVRVNAQTTPGCSGLPALPDVDPYLLELLLSSDSSLSDVPSDVSSIAIEDCPPASTTNLPTGDASCVPNQTAQPPPPKTPRKKLAKISPYFPKPPGDVASCLPFPPISARSFGLIQEQLAHDPFRLLLATIFLNRTRGGVAIPVLFRVFEQYPTIEAMADANLPDLVEMIHCLGFQNQRARKCIELAKTWLVAPPAKGKRYRKLHYPKKGDGRDVGAEECIDDDEHDPRVAWEIAHLPGIGAYAMDSWRIFCRDELRGLASDWKGNTTSTGTEITEKDEAEKEEQKAFIPEWKRVLPMDKELRAYLTWMWLKEGWVWNRETGERHRASEKMMRAAEKGGLAHEEQDGNWVLDMSPVKVCRIY
jgi:endonuclease III